MDVVLLDGTWELWHGEEGSHPVHPGRLEELGAALPADVPGNVELDLLRAGRIEEPFFGRNTFLLREYEFHEWWYRRRFSADSALIGRAADIVFEGLDTVAEVWLNDESLGSSANALVPQRFSVTRALRAGENELVVRLGSAVNWARQQRYEPIQDSWERRDEALWLRKPAHCFGWDITPRVVSAGIWRSVRLEVRGPDEIEDLYFYVPDCSERSATLSVWFKVETEGRIPDDLTLRVRGVCGDSTFSAEVALEFVAGHARIPIENPKLWWPKGYGEPNLYEVTTELLRGGEVRAVRKDRVGIRTIRLDYAEEKGGRFRFIVNGVSIRVLGSNWVPLDAFHSRDLGRTGPAIDLFDDLACQMIRVWGGGVYESDRFYDLCDEKGMLVWQDFAFACARYPQSADFQEVVRREAEAAVARLRNHPSLALWSGDNECDYGYNTPCVSPEDNVLTRRVLPEVVRRLDPWRSYLRSSPYFSPGVCQGNNQPEQHLWGARDYFKGPYYTHHTADFISEIGYHGCPNVSSLERFLPKEDLWPWDNPSWRAHSVEHWSRVRRYYDRNELMANQVREFFGAAPEDLAAFVRASQFTQAEAKKFFVEQARIRGLGGVLWWNVIDCWPQISDAVVDYYFTKKLAYHYLWRVQRPLCVMISEPDAWSVRVVADNIGREDAAATISVRDGDTDEVLLGDDFRIPANGALEAGRIPVFRGAQKLFLIEWECDGVSFGNHYLLGSPPFSRDHYEKWLPKIAALPRAFDPAAVGR